MSKDNSDSFKLSRRKALASMGAIGAAGALGIGGTYAQFTDTEGAQATFTAGGIDGTVQVGASYNGVQLQSQNDAVEGYVSFSGQELDGEVPGATIHLEDVKPGDYGSFTFCLEVTNNPAWVASCLGIQSDTDGVEYEPESALEEDGQGISSESLNAQDAPKSFGQQASDGTDIYGSSGPGELAENLLLIPYYTDQLYASFFDNGWPNYDFGPEQAEFSQVTGFSTQTIGTNEAFWNSREGENDWEQLRPMSLRQAAQSQLAQGTVEWNDPQNGGSFNPQPAPEGLTTGDGCIFVNGDLAVSGNTTPDTNNDEQPAGVLQPGDQVYFGYDWTVPYGASNALQGDELVVDVGFNFAQVRHTSEQDGAPSIPNPYSPGANTPDGS